MLSQCHGDGLKMTAVRAPIPLFGAHIQIQKCIEVLIRNSKKGNICFSFTLEAVNYSQKGMKKSKRPKTTFCRHPNLDLEEDEQEDEDKNEEEMEENSGRVSPPPSL